MWRGKYRKNEEGIGRKWSSTYEALQDSRPNRNKLMKRYIEEIPSSEYVLLGIDHTAWGRRGAKTLKDRTYEHQASSNNSVTVGQGYSTIAWRPEEVGTWTLPLRQERITSHETPISKAAWQLKQVSKHLSTKTLVVLDSEYGNGSWVNQTEDIQVSKLMRIRSNCCLWSKPDGYSGKGRPRKHNQKFKVNDPTTWWKANETIEIEDPKLGKLKISQWKELHFRSSPSHDMSLIRVERLNPRSSGKKPRSLWLVWVGEQFLELKDIWSQYARRFGVDHWYRFAKQRLHWTLPSFSTAKQSERWSNLMPLMSWQLWLAKDLVEEHHLPWATSQKNLTPGRVAQSLFSLLVAIGTPASSPKTRGKSPGWITGVERNKKKTYPIAKKSYSRPKKSETKTA
ncbi:MAG: NF041680 family putative transposase [Xenococcaceae cyanobacterium MO_188.B29]|nr:NF041680 family putative transposase [Xenococcaceae cyanobacterium MO_188.B29]